MRVACGYRGSRYRAAGLRHAREIPLWCRLRTGRPRRGRREGAASRCGTVPNHRPGLSAWQAYVDFGAAAERAGHLKFPSQSLDSVAQACQPTAVDEGGGAAPAVQDPQAELAVLLTNLDLRLAGAGVLCDVAERLAHDEVGCRFHDRLPAYVRNVDVDGEGQPLGHRLHRGDKACMGQYGRMQPAGQIA